MGAFNIGIPAKNYMASKNECAINSTVTDIIERESREPNIPFIGAGLTTFQVTVLMGAITIIPLQLSKTFVNETYFLLSKFRRQ